MEEQETNQEQEVSQIETPAEVQPEKPKKEKRQKVADDENLTDDELYAKIQTEKLLKKKKSKKIATFAALCVAMVLAICIIVLAAVPANLKPRCLKADFDEVTLIVGDISDRHYEKDDEKYDEFTSYFNKSFSQPYLSALFSGALFDYDIDEDKTDVSLNNNARDVIRNRVGRSSNLVELYYRTEQVITSQNGKVYQPTTVNASQYSFNYVYFVVGKDAGVRQAEIYFVAYYPNPNDATLRNYRIVTVSLRADTSIIYNAWSTLTDQ